MPPVEDLRAALLRCLVALAPVAALALALAFWLTPEALAAGAPWHLVGLDAPGCAGCGLCGMSRAFSALAHGRVADAVELNAGVIAAWPLAWAAALGGPLLLTRTLKLRRRACRSPR